MTTVVYCNKGDNEYSQTPSPKFFFLFNSPDNYFPPRISAAVVYDVRLCTYLFNEIIYPPQLYTSEPGFGHESVVQLQGADVLVSLVFAQVTLAHDDRFERAAHIFWHVLRIAREIKYCALTINQFP